MAAKLFLSWCVLEGELDTHPMARIEQPKVTRKLVQVLTPDQLAALMRDTGGKDFADVRDRALLMLFGDTGCRVGEVAGLRLPDLDLRERTALVTGKGNRQRVVPFGAATAAALDRYLRARRRQRYGDRDWLWLSSTAKGRFTVNGVQQTFRRRGERLGFHVHPHMFRHTFADSWLRQGGSEGDLMELAGWSTRQMVLHYGASTRADRARQAYRARSSPMDGLAP
jgi:site-specific recombinase XerD